MKTKEQIFRMLKNAEGDYVSGEHMAEILKISRNSVWKGIKALRADGYVITAVTNKGYRLSENGVFTADAVYSELSEELCDKISVTVLPSVGSTNTELKAVAEKGGKEGEVLIALQQTNGKGRLGRSFFSPKDTGLYMSILLRPEFSAEESLYITACAACAAARTIDAAAGVNSEIKWVNDIYLNGKKVCGILTEASLDFESGRLNYAVLGVGINLIIADFPENLISVAGSISSGNKDLRPFIAAEFMNNFFSEYKNLGAHSFIDEYRRRSMLIGKDITFSRGSEIFCGRVLDIDDRVRLVVGLDSGEVTAFSSGEVQLVKGDLIK